MNTKYQFKINIPGIDPAKVTVNTSRNIYNDIVLNLTYGEDKESWTLNYTSGHDFDRIDYQFGQLLVLLKERNVPEKAKTKINIL